MRWWRRRWLVGWRRGGGLSCRGVTRGYGGLVAVVRVVVDRSSLFLRLILSMLEISEFKMTRRRTSRPIVVVSMQAVLCVVAEMDMVG